MQVKIIIQKMGNRRPKESGEGIYNGDIGYVYHIDKDKKTIYILFDQTKIVSYLYDELDEIDHSFVQQYIKAREVNFQL